MRFVVGLVAALLLIGCATVRQEDLNAWVGQPVSALDIHPVWITVPLVRTITPDGVEIRNYINGAQVSTCSRGGVVTGGVVDYATYTSFTQCMAREMACHNIFVIRNGVVERYTPVGRGGAMCYTTSALQPGFNGSVNIR